MKKLIVNGCSFVAGDALVWDQYIQEQGYPYISWEEIISKSRNDFLEKIYFEYTLDYRKKQNLPAIISNFLNTTVTDLSLDGNSNDSISFETIQYLFTLPEKERQNYHIIIGWTAPSRNIKYSKKINSFINLHIGLLDFKNEFTEELKDYIIATTGKGYDEDHYLGYIKNIIMLESFLKANNCTYTFYRSLGWENDISFPIHSCLPNFKYSEFDGQYSDNNCWYQFESNKGLALTGSSIATEYLHNQPHNMVTEKNGHPNLKTITEFSKKLVEHIKKQDVGF